MDCPRDGWDALFERSLLHDDYDFTPELAPAVTVKPESPSALSWDAMAALLFTSEMAALLSRQDSKALAGGTA